MHTQEWNNRNDSSKKAGSVIAVELNETAVKDAIKNARHEKINNIRFVHGDAGKFMDGYKEAVDVVFMWTLQERK